MKPFRSTVRSLVVTLAGAAMLAAPLAAQQEGTPDRPLRPVPPDGRAVVPFMEGWYANDDGSVEISFGYWNLNRSRVVEIPLGERNYMEPARFDGMQPTTFIPARQHGVFGITVPADMADEDVWWYLTTEDGEVHKIPGRATAEAYQLDRNPRPHGTVPPLVWFDDESAAAQGPQGLLREEVVSATVGEPVAVAAQVRDPSERDPDDRRVRDGVPVRVVWYKHQGPGDVTFSEHESRDESARSGNGLIVPGMQPAPGGARSVTLPGGEGTAAVYATFSEPGEYMLRARADNWSANDSNALDQCCWTNGYVRVDVSP